MTEDISSSLPVRGQQLRERIRELEAELAALATPKRSSAPASAESRDAAEHYQTLVESFDGQIYICSRDRRIEFMNRRLIERSGRKAVGELCYKVLHDRATPCPW